MHGVVGNFGGGHMQVVGTEITLPGVIDRDYLLDYIGCFVNFSRELEVSVVKSVVLTVLLGCIVASTAMAGSTQTMLFRGTGVVSKSGFHTPAPVKFVVAAVMDISNDDRVKFGYKAEFSDGSSEKLALELSGTDAYTEGEPRKGKAELLVHSGTRQRAEGFAGASATWTEIDGDGMQVEFTREDGSKMEIVFTMQTSPSRMGDMIPDIKTTITVNDLPNPNVRDGIAFNWEILSRLDFNALMRVDDTSADVLLKELFDNN